MEAATAHVRDSRTCRHVAVPRLIKYAQPFFIFDAQRSQRAMPPTPFTEAFKPVLRTPDT